MLLARPAWTHVTVLHRRTSTLPPDLPADQAAKLTQVVIDMDTLATHHEAFAGVDAVFCALGTTRKAAGSAAAFKKVDLEYVAAGARAAAAAGVRMFSLVSAQGANAGVWASDAAPFHALLYTQTKGKVAVVVVEGVYHVTPSMFPTRQRRRSRRLAYLWCPSTDQACSTERIRRSPHACSNGWRQS